MKKSAKTDTKKGEKKFSPKVQKPTLQCSPRGPGR